MTVDQFSEIELFQRRYADRIEQTRERILAGVEPMMRHYKEKGLSDDLVEGAIKLARDGQLDAVLVFLRSSAGRICQRVNSSLYWSWIDAAAFFSDASGARWPYMTLALREQYLAWSSEHILSLSEKCHAS